MSDTRHAGKRIALAPGIYQDKFGISVIASVGSGERRITSAEIRFPLGTELPTLQARWHREKMRLKDQQAKGGGPIVRGLLSGDVVRYLETATLSKARRHERKQQLDWWLTHFGPRKRASLEAPELLKALNSLDVSASTKDKYRTALSHVFTVLDGKNATNPFREIPRFDKGHPERRDQPYELIDAILAHVRDRGRGKKPSRTKAFLSVEAYAPVTRAQLVRMTPGDVHWETSEISTPGRHKGGGTRPRRKPISADALAAFRLFDAADCWGLRPSKSSIWRTFTAARDEAIAELRETRPDLDLSRAVTMRPYDLRHSFAALTYAQTGSLSITGQLLDHEDQSTTLRYAQGAVPAHLKAAGEKVAAALAARPKYQPPPTVPPAAAQKAALRLVKRARA
jgi:integrase